MSTGPMRRGFLEADAVSAVFPDTDAVDRALVRLNRAGVPRDLVDVVVSPAAAERFYRGKARPLGREAVRYAGIGGLVGLIAGAVISLAIVAVPGFQDAGLTAVVQLIGPNLATVSGAVIGGIIGLFVQRRVERRFERAAEAPDSIIVVVTARSEEEVRGIGQMLVESGGRDPRLER